MSSPLTVPTLLWGLVLATAALPAQAAIFRVGVGKGCTHSSIQAAVNAATSTTDANTIQVTDTGSYTRQHILIRNRSRLTIEGGYASCSSLAGTGSRSRTLIDGAGATAGSVFVVDESSVTLRNLDIIGGASNDFGGGILIEGLSSSSVGLENTRVGQNSALDGGGVAVIGSGVVTLGIGTDSTVEVNSARRNGGGVYCHGTFAQVFLYGRRSRVVGNSAIDGGGIHGDRCLVRVATGSRYGDGGTIYSNSASGNGGGVSLLNGGDLLMWNTDAQLPVGISGNHAGGFGGALSLVNSRAELVESIVDGNSANLAGGAVYLETRAGSPSVAFTRDFGTLPEAVACAPTLNCNRISNNVARSLAGYDQHGSVLYALSATTDPLQGIEATFSRASLFGNQGYSLLRTQVAAQTELAFQIADSELRNNVAASNLLELVAPTYASNPAEPALALLRSTVAGNAIGTVFAGSAVLFAQRNVTLSHDILWQPGARVLAASGVGVSPQPVNYSLVSDTSGFSAPASVLIANPQFANLAGGDLRPLWGSPAIDFAPLSGSVDRRGVARGIDLPTYNNRYGSQDLGAYEVATDPGGVICCAR